jgi:hypothetical protein
MPERTSFFKTAVLLLEGPNVQIIFVLLIFGYANFVSCETTVQKYSRDFPFDLSPMTVLLLSTVVSLHVTT